MGFFFCIVNVGLIKISTSSLGEKKIKIESSEGKSTVIHPDLPVVTLQRLSPVVSSLNQALKTLTYIHSTKEVKGVCVWEGGFLNGLPVLCDKRHGLHGELG